MQRPTITQQITFIYTDDLEKSAAFYENILGFDLWLDQGSCRIYKVSSTGLIGICQSSDQSKGAFSAGEQTHVILTIVTPEVDDWYAYLKAKGITFDKPPTLNTTYHIYHCFLRDPNGYLIEIQRFMNQSD